MFDVDRQEVKRSYFEVHQLARLLRFLTLQIESYLIRVQFLALDQLLSCLLGVKIQVVAVTAIEKEVIFVSNNDIVRVLRFKTNLHRQIQTLVIIIIKTIPFAVALVFSNMHLLTASNKTLLFLVELVIFLQHYGCLFCA